MNTGKKKELDAHTEGVIMAFMGLEKAAEACTAFPQKQFYESLGQMLASCEVMVGELVDQVKRERIARN